MYNDLFSIGPFTAHGYGLMIAIGALGAYLVAEKRAKKKGLNYELIFNLFIWCLVGGILGAKLLYYIVEIKSIMKDPKLLLDIAGGFVVYGGIIGGIFSGYLFSRKYKVNFLEYFDLVMPSIALAQGFGRIGCLLAGCCYGIETNSPLGIVFHNSELAPNGVNLVPTQIISSGLNFLHFFVLILIARKKRPSGQIAGLYLLFYSIGRFVLEFFRGDLERGSVGSISTSQFISIFLCIAGLGIVIVSGIKGKKSYVSTNEEENQVDENQVNENHEEGNQMIENYEEEIQVETSEENL